MSNLAYALDYAEGGIAVFPCKPGDKTPILCPNGLYDATTKRQVIEGWWTSFPKANIASPVAADELVLDIDPKHGGFESLAKLETKYGKLPRTFTAKTGSDGGHRRFKCGASLNWRKNLDKLGYPGIDLKVVGGYVVVPPSYTADAVRTDPSGKVWGNGHYEVVDDSPLAEIPAWFIELATRPTNGEYDKASDRVDPDFVFDGIPEGQRNNELWRYASSMRARNLKHAEAVQLMGIAMETCGYEEEAPEDMVDRAWKYPPGVSGHEITPDQERFDEEEEEETLPEFPKSAWRGVVDEYRILMTNVSECPDVFHYANFMTFIASEMGTEFVLAEDGRTTANLYTFCVGVTGIKKSTATNLLKHNIADIHSAAAFHSSVSSAEGLIRVLNEDNNIVLCYDELADLLSTAARSGQRIEPILNMAFDQQTLRATVKKAKESLEADGYYLNLLMNGTPDHVRTQLTDQIFSGGFLNRLLVFGSMPTDREQPFMRKPEEQQARYVVSELSRVRNDWLTSSPQGFGAVSVGYDDDARRLFSDWYHQQHLAKQKASDFENKVLERLQLYAKKLALIYYYLESSAATASPSITGEQMQASLDVMEYCKASMLWITRHWAGPKTVQQQSQNILEQRIKDYLLANGCTGERTLYRNLHEGAKDCKAAIDPMNGLSLIIGSSRPRMIHRLGCACFPKKDT